MKKHAYLIMAHNNFYVLERLMKLLDHSRNDIFIHIDKKVCNFEWMKCASWCRESKVYFTRKRISVVWGNETQIKAEMLLFREAYTKGPYAYYHFISGSDLPLRTQEEIHAFFEDKCVNFLFYDEPTIYDIQRISKYRNPVRWGSKKFRNAMNNIIDVFQNKLNINRLKNSKQYPIIKRGWNWCNLTQEAVEMILKAKKDIKRMTRFSVCSDEMYKQIVLLNNGIPTYKEEKSDGIRYIDWSNGGNHPSTFTIDDYDRLINSEKLFARKFDENVDRKIIDKIYDYLRG